MSTERRLGEYKKFIEKDEKEWNGSFYFIQGADTQFGLIERYIEKREDYGWEKEKILARKCVEKINALEPKPKFFVICGDLCDAYPGPEEGINKCRNVGSRITLVFPFLTESSPIKYIKIHKKRSLLIHNLLSIIPVFTYFFTCLGTLYFRHVKRPLEWTEIRKKQEEDFWEIFNKIDPSIPLICVCGNHDVGDTPTRIAVEKYRSSFGEDYFSFWVGGVLFIVINSQYFFDDSLIPELAREQEEWLDAQLKKSSSSRHGAVIFQHIPWFLTDPDDKKEAYFAIPYANRKAMLEKLYNAGVRHVFCGHLHKNLIGHYKDLESVVTSAVGAQLGDDESGFRIVKVLEDKIQHTYYPFDKVPENVNL